ncbi:MAG: HEPN domain-containing protein [Euryarchaeota archaeon]|nr:HEPN domain-containing protein [Euryarchaeota archaeon]
MYNKKDPRAPERVESSLEIAERFLRSAERNLEIEEHEMAEIAAYNSAFHSARALLFAEGYTERSHYCLGIALRTLYKGQIVDLLKTFDKIRLSRHNVQYGGVLVGEEEAEFVITFAEEFLSCAKADLMKGE